MIKKITKLLAHLWLLHISLIIFIYFNGASERTLIFNILTSNIMGVALIIISISNLMKYISDLHTTSLINFQENLFQLRKEIKNGNKYETDTDSQKDSDLQ